MNYLKVNRDNIPLYYEQILLAYPDITDYQAELMLHALGADHKKFRKYKEEKIYHAYRNYYDAGGRDITLWNDLVSKGLADHKGRFYHVTVKGIKLLEILTRCRIWGNYQCVADCKKDVLEYMMEADVFCGYGCWNPVSSGAISLNLSIPKPLVRKTLNKLAEESLVEKGYCGGIDDEGFPHCVHGWYLTQTARDKYKERYEELKKAEYARINKEVLEHEEN